MDTIEEDMGAVLAMVAEGGALWRVPAGLLPGIMSRVVFAVMELERRGEIVCCSATLLEQLQGCAPFVVCRKERAGGRFRVTPDGRPC